LQLQLQLHGRVWGQVQPVGAVHLQVVARDWSLGFPCSSESYYTTYDL
jgi:hypothetical protein